MGQVRDLARLMDWSLDNYDKWSVWGDQSVFAVYWLQHLAEVTLDYSGALALSLSDLRWELLVPMKCILGQWLFFNSHRNQKLQVSLGQREANSSAGEGAFYATSEAEFGLSANDTDEAKWMLTDAGDGKVYITSHRPPRRQLSDVGGHLHLSASKTSFETWRLSNAGDGNVFMTSHRDRQLQDADGRLKFSANMQGWESWYITSMDGKAACLEVRPRGGVVRNWGFDRPQCLIHGNGRGVYFFRHLLKMLTNGTIAANTDE